MTAGLNIHKKTALTAEQVAYTIHFAASFPDGGCPTEINLDPQYIKADGQN
jgi:uncharacterized protein YchJ